MVGISSKRGRWFALCAAAALGLGGLSAASSRHAQAQESIEAQVSAPQGLPVFVVGGDYAWHVDVSLPMDAGAETATYFFDWGDGTTSSVVQHPGNCESNQCWMEGSHRFTQAGLFDVRVTATQGGATPVTVDAGPAMVWRLDQAATLAGFGTLQAGPGSGGHYDSDFPGGLVSFTVTASRPRASTATFARLDVSVPSMTPDSGGRGMYFRGTEVLEPLYVSATGTARDAVLGLVFGQVTKADGTPAGTAYAVLHVRTAGGTRQARIVVQNTSAGYTYVDTGWLQNDGGYPLYPQLDPGHDRLTTGSVVISG